jgi:hypothetical protein
MFRCSAISVPAQRQVAYQLSCDNGFVGAGTLCYLPAIEITSTINTRNKTSASPRAHSSIASSWVMGLPAAACCLRGARCHFFRNSSFLSSLGMHLTMRANIRDLLEQMKQKLKTEAGPELYRMHKAIVEPVFGQIKEWPGFRPFLLRGLQKVRAEWKLICLTHNLLENLRVLAAEKAVLRDQRALRV